MALTQTQLSRMKELVGAGLTRPLAWRREQLQRLSALVEEHESEVLEALAADLGKPPTEAFFELVALRQELKLTGRQLERWMRPRRVAVPLSLRPGQAKVVPEPLGCVLVIGPWNYPFQLTLRPLISALAAGNTAVLKPSEHASAIADLIARLIPQHFEPEVVQVVQAQVAPEDAQTPNSFKADLDYKGVPLSVNLSGLRDRPVATDKPEGIRRVAMVGASVLMGSGVEVDRTFENLLEDAIADGALGDRGTVELDDKHHVAARHLMTRDLGDRWDIAVVLEVIEVDRIERHLAHHHALAWGKLSDDALIN